MIRTALKAVEILKTGNVELAWEVAQQDEGLLPHVTRDAWLAHAIQTIARNAATEASYAE